MSASIHQGTDDNEAESLLSKNKTHNFLHMDTERVRVYLASLLQRVRARVTMDTLRPLPMFLGLTGPAFCIAPDAFNAPARHVDKSLPEKIKTRISLNVKFFLTNYVLMVAMVAVVVALSHPGMLLVLGGVWALWWCHSYLIDHEVVLAGRNVGTIMSISHRSTALTALTVLAIVWKCLVPVISFVAISGVLVLSHASMRDPNHIESSSNFSGSADSDDEEDSGGNGSSSGDGVIVERGDVV